MIAASAALAGYESIHRLLGPEEIDNLGWVAAWLRGSWVLGNEAVTQYRTRAGQRVGSAALIADGHHACTDGFTSLAVVLAVGGGWLGLERADPIVGLAITVVILFVLKGAAGPGVEAADGHDRT